MSRADVATDVAIIGAGPVGLALGLALHRAGIACVVLDARPRGSVREDKRVLALSHGSRQTLARLGVWPENASSFATSTPIASIHISQRGGLGRTLLTADEENVAALGYVVDAGILGGALEDACAQAGVAIRHDVRVDAIEAGKRDARLRLAGGTVGDGAKKLGAQLVACAEGSVTEALGVIRHDYAQQALIAIVQTRQAHEHRAWERFTPDGPLALLPHGRDYALVWTVADQDAPALLALSDVAFVAKLQDAFGNRHEFVGVSKRNAFPLSLRYRIDPTGPCTVWLGNAAQTLHPVAGQGFNLALRDVSVLLQTLCAIDRKDYGASATLARYARARRVDRVATIRFTDALIRLFGGENPLLKQARGAGLIALDLLPAARSFLARRMIFGARAF